MKPNQSKPSKAKPAKTNMTPLTSPSQIPDRMTELEAANFWDSHEITDAFLEAVGSIPEQALPPTRASSRVTSIRLDLDLETRLKVLAARKHKPYQTLLKDFVLERVYEEEKRLKIV
jgi:CopG antitoxin of type II toxin-antitoxin system